MWTQQRSLPASVALRLRRLAATADWQFFNPRYPEIAIAAWFREWSLEGEAGA